MKARHYDEHGFEMPEPHEYAIMVTAMLGLLIVMRCTRRKGRRS